MQDSCKSKAMRWLVVGGLLLVMSLTSMGFVQAATEFSTWQEALQYIREEEKLARDVYLVLYDQFRLTIFKNIAASEQKHMDAIKNLLVKYRLSDPAAGKEIGEFTNPAIQLLYNELRAEGTSSVPAALEVGVKIEELDMKDLDEAISISTKYKDIINVYSNLYQGSENHLAAFQSHLEILKVKP
jgi:hypothetical protein